jgi:hypothetical protein
MECFKIHHSNGLVLNKWLDIYVDPFPVGTSRRVPFVDPRSPGIFYKLMDILLLTVVSDGGGGSSLDVWNYLSISGGVTGRQYFVHPKVFFV